MRSCPIVRHGVPDLRKAEFLRIQLLVDSVAVSTEGLANLLCLALHDGSRAAQVSLALMAHPTRQVAGAALPVACLALGRQTETLLRTLMGFLLRHDYDRTSTYC